MKPKISIERILQIVIALAIVSAFAIDQGYSGSWPDHRTADFSHKEGTYRTIVGDTPTLESNCAGSFCYDPTGGNIINSQNNGWWVRPDRKTYLKAWDECTEVTNSSTTNSYWVSSRTLAEWNGAQTSFGGIPDLTAVPDCGCEVPVFLGKDNTSLTTVGQCWGTIGWHQGYTDCLAFAEAQGLTTLGQDRIRELQRKLPSAVDNLEETDNSRFPCVVYLGDDTWSGCITRMKNQIIAEYGEAAFDVPPPIETGFTARNYYAIDENGSARSPAFSSGNVDVSVLFSAWNTEVCPNVIDGGWSDWSPWSPDLTPGTGDCPVPCNGAAQTRTRTCDNPPPRYGGLPCAGSATDSQTCNATVCSCTGSDPANASYCTGDNTGLTDFWPKVVVDTCTSGRKCEMTCNANYHTQGSFPSMTCQANTCASGPYGANTGWCAGDNQAGTVPTHNMAVTYVERGSCTATKCERRCDLNHVLNGTGTACRPVCYGAVAPGSSACTGDTTGLSAPTTWLVVPTCTTTRKCERTCTAAGWSYSP